MTIEEDPTANATATAVDGNYPKHVMAVADLSALQLPSVTVRMPAQALFDRKYTGPRSADAVAVEAEKDGRRTRPSTDAGA